MKKIIFLLLPFIYFACSSAEDFQKDVFYPESKTGILSYYINGQPFGAFIADSSDYYIISLEKIRLTEDGYLRLWLLCQNNNEEPYLLEPQKIALIKLKYKDKVFELKPTLPSKLLSDIENEKLTKQIFETIGQSLEAINTRVNTKNTKITDNKGNEIIIHDKDEKTENKINDLNDKLDTRLNNINNWYGIFSASVNNGILRKNTLFNNYSVNGYIYFYLENDKKFDRFDASTYQGNNSFEFSKSKVSLYIQTKSGLKEIEFKQLKSE